MYVVIKTNKTKNEVLEIKMEIKVTNNEKLAIMYLSVSK